MRGLIPNFHIHVSVLSGYMHVELGRRSFISVNICLEFSVQCEVQCASPIFLYPTPPGLPLSNPVEKAMSVPFFQSFVYCLLF